MLLIISQYLKDKGYFLEKLNRDNFKKLPHYDGGD